MIVRRKSESGLRKVHKRLGFVGGGELWGSKFCGGQTG